MSKIETTSKVSLKLPSRINLGRHGARRRRALELGHNLQARPLPHHAARKGLSPGQKGPIASTGTINNPPPRPTPRAPQKRRQMAIIDYI